MIYPLGKLKQQILLHKSPAIDFGIWQGFAAFFPTYAADLYLSPTILAGRLTICFRGAAKLVAS